MAKVTITITDSEKDGTINVDTDFDPPAKRDVPLTAAQCAAFTAVEALTKAAVSEVIEE